MLAIGKTILKLYTIASQRTCQEQAGWSRKHMAMREVVEWQTNGEWTDRHTLQHQ